MSFKETVREDLQTLKDEIIRCASMSDFNDIERNLSYMKNDLRDTNKRIDDIEIKLNTLISVISITPKKQEENK